jgi:hypothetical protein
MKRDDTYTLAGRATLAVNALADRALDAETKLAVVRDIVNGDWGINPTRAIECIIKVVDPRPECEHLPDLRNPLMCVKCRAFLEPARVSEDRGRG